MAVRLIPGAPFNAPSDTRVLSRKKTLLQSTVPLATLPSSYQSNTARERTLLDFVEHFRRQFFQLYPLHQPLLLSPLNECGTRKFVCTSVLPTLLPFPDLYDLAACAAFVADFFTFLPLDSPHALPDLLASLSSIAATRHGDCLDLSTVLCSLLRGAGYNAYVVAGEAEGWVARGDETGKRCPLLRDEAEEQRRADEEVERRAADDRSRNRYLALVADKPPHASNFQARRQRDADKRQDAVQASDEEAAAAQQRRKKQAHAWVLVLPGRRDVAAMTFVEASTGTLYDVKGGGLPYASVSSLWCDENYWVNIQSAPMDGLSFELSNRHHWLPVVQQPEAAAVKAPASTSTPVGGGGGSGEYDEDGRAEYEEKEAITTPKPTAKAQPAPAAALPAKQLLHLPASWVSPLRITRDQWQARYPGGSKRVEYRLCTVERHSSYAPHMAGLVTRIAERDGADGRTVRVEERYEHRRDRLVLRVTDTRGERRVVCGFDKGLASGLQEWSVWGEEGREARREFRFYAGSRVDGLVRRVEAVGVKVTEEYEGREDRLVYRSLAVDTQPAAAPHSSAAGPSAASLHRQKQYAVSIGLHADLPIRKLTERFAPNPAAHPETDVVKRTHLLHANTIQLTFATTRHALQGSTWVIDKNDKLDTSEPTAAEAANGANNAASGAAGPATNLSGTNAANGTSAATNSSASLAATTSLGVSGGVSRSRLDRKTRGWAEMSRADEQVMIGRLLLLEKELKVKLKGREQRMTELLRELCALDSATELTDDVYDAAYRTAFATAQAKLQHAQSVSSAAAGQSPDAAVASGGGSVDGVSSHHGHTVSGMGLDEAEADYLTPFLLPFPANQLLSRKQCEAVRAACLTALKERLLSRAAIIQSHLEDEQNKLTQKQNAFKRQAGGGGATTSAGPASGGSGASAVGGGSAVGAGGAGGSDEANEEFQQFSEQCLFRIDILLARRARHEQLAVSKYHDMERQLSNDPRLAALHD